jgi:glutamate N-acetyltransferase/amino-acid N-acetyltransferase
LKKVYGGICAPLGFRASAISSGIKTRGRKDLALIFSVVPSVAYGVFTKNKFAAAPVLISKARLLDFYAQAVIINSGSANCCTGKKGEKDAQAITKALSKELNIEQKDVLSASTGTIGKFLPIEKMKKALPKLVKTLSKDASKDAAEAIMTTDLFPKQASVQVDIGKKKVKIGGIAKGAGMIAPNMATMLCFITTDASIEPAALKKALKEATNATFNLITVDGDTSTNDSVVVMASGLAANKRITERSKEFAKFLNALKSLMEELALMIVKDGEGASKTIEVKVKGARTKEDAREVAKKICNSPLVKTAVYGSDPNWGRIVASCGNSDVKFDPDKINVSIANKKVFSNGSPCKFNKAELKKNLDKDTVNIEVDLKSGKKDAVMWSCDLTEKYVRINSRYTT